MKNYLLCKSSNTEHPLIYAQEDFYHMTNYIKKLKFKTYLQTDDEENALNLISKANSQNGKDIN